MTPSRRDEIERAFRAHLKELRCLGCGEHMTDAAIEWGRAQPRELERDGPQLLKCELCEAILSYDIFARSLTWADAVKTTPT